MLRRPASTILLLAGLSAAAVAQEAPRRPSRPAPGIAPIHRVPAAEAVLGMRARLDLSEDQVARLGTLRREALERRTSAMAQLLALQSELRAGDLTRDAFAARMSEHREALRGAAAADAESVRGMLTDAQRDRLQQIRRFGQRQRFGMGRGTRTGRGGLGPSRFGRGTRFGPGPVRRRGAWRDRPARPWPGQQG